jgi:hypothetical protein
MKIKDRIRELRRVRAKELIPNPKNWRTHPRAQQDALRGLLSEIGYVDALLARETPEGLMLIDGHLRAETTPDAEVPVLVLDVSEAEATAILATFDPVGAMAETDHAALDAVLAEVQIASDAVNQMLAEIAEESRDVFDAGEEAGLAQEAECEEIAEKYAIVVNCESEEQQRELLDRFEQEGLKCRALIA